MFHLLPLRPSILALNTAKRIVTGPNVSRSLLLTRSFSRTPLVAATATRSATTTKSAQAESAKSTKPTAAKTSSGRTKSAKPKPEPKKKKEAKKPAKKATLTKKDIKTPPKPNMSPFLVFFNESRAASPKPTTLKESQDRVAKLAAQWRTLTDAEKQKYVDKALEIIRERTVLYKEWLKNVDPNVLKEINKRRKASGKNRIRPSPDRPRKPPSSFMRFLADFKIQHPHLALLEASIEAGNAWRSLPAIEKQKYDDIAKAEMKTYHLEKEARAQAQQPV